MLSITQQAGIVDLISKYNEVKPKIMNLVYQEITNEYLQDHTQIMMYMHQQVEDLSVLKKRLVYSFSIMLNHCLP